MRQIILQWIGEGEPLPKQEVERAAAELSSASADRHPIGAAARTSTSHRRPPTTPSASPTAGRATTLLAAPATLLLGQGVPRGNWLARCYRATWFIAVATVVSLAVAVYVGRWETPLTGQLLHYIPLPYGFVRYHPIWYGSVQNERQTLTRFHQQQGSDDPPPTLADIEAILVRRTIANDLAWGYGLWVSTAEVKRAFSAIVQKAGSEERVLQTLRQLWNFDATTYQERVLRPYLLKEKLLVRLRQDPVTAHELGETSDLRALDNYLDKLRPVTAVFIFR